MKFDSRLDAQGYGFAVGDAGMAYRIVPVTAGATNSFSYTNIAVDAVLASDKGTGIPNQNLSSVQFSDRLTGYITGSNAAGATGGLVLKTVDGGAHWKLESSGSTALTGSPLLALSADGQNGTLVGADGSVQTLNDQAEQFSSRFWYDELGRLVLSQNSKQFNIVNYVPAASVAAATSTTNPGTVRGYSYTLYDPIGRIIEVGELLTDQPVIPFNNPSQVQYVAVHVPFVQGGFRHQVSTTVYDINAAAPAGFTPSYLRNRVAYSAYSPEPGTPAQQTHYSYDVHGNVKSMVQVVQYDGQLLAKRVDYSYDLVSGKVNNVCYQQGQADQLNHKYTYDADNRITQVQTSTDSILWTQDAAYQYYAHGPLAQTTLGELTVETDNYAYTIQGWIKQMQGAAFSYALGYNSTDYKAISATASILATPIATGKDLYNGNIASMTSNTPAIAAGNFQQQYTYDQLNRITSSGTGAGNAYKTGYSYDANGNILALARYDGALTPAQFDNLAYNYENTAGGYKRQTNKLRSVSDAVGTTATTADIENQAADNYSYDAIGNLVKDNQEEIANIEWTVSGKIHAVTRKNGSLKPNLQFEYDASDQRTVKKVLKTDGSSQTTYYLRDASGNVMGVYQYSIPATGTAVTPGNAPVLTEQYLYGSSRLGVLTPGSSNMSVSALGVTGSRMFGAKSYEITDHLGNVRVALSDYTTQATPQIVNSANDYYPFGMVARSAVSPQVYRYGFNGKEHEDETVARDYAFEYRIYDSRIGRFLSVDPLSPKYPNNSPYAFSENRVIDGIELEGLEVILIHGTTQSNSDLFDDNTLTQFKRIAGNTVVDKTFSWGENSKLTNSRDKERKTSAIKLANHVLVLRTQLIKDKIITANEPITLVGYSHGGNVAIQAAKLIEAKTGMKVNIITVATPAYNDGSSEDPTGNTSIAKHINIYSEGDGVDAIAGGDERYTNPNTINLKIGEKYIAYEGTIDTHSNMGNKSKNSGIGVFLKEILDRNAPKKK